jgi:Holliday junction resolvase RusA-like endonuclease
MRGEIFPGKPDWDNVGKIISDALNEVAYKDDSQIYQCTVAKMYSDRPRVFVQITTFEGG